MRSDGVEIVMAVEEAFDIRIENSEAEKILTPGQLIDLTMSKVQVVIPDVCLTHRSFNLLRTFFLGQSALTRSDIAPRTELKHLFPRNQRATVLGQFGISLAIPAPGLVRPGWLK